MASGLRAELGAPPDPEFVLSLPAGWSRLTPDRDTRERLERDMRSKFLHAHRPDLMAEARAMLVESFDRMQQERVVAVFGAFDPHGAGQLPVATSITARFRSDRADLRLDDLAKHAIREYGGEPLFGDQRTLRFEREESSTVGGEDITMSTTTYLTPVPGTKRLRALELNAVYGRPSSVPRDAPTIRAVHALFDTMASTLRWERAATTGGAA